MWVLVIATVGLFGFALLGGESEAPLELVARQAQSPDNGEPEGLAPDISGSDINGQLFDLASYRGEKPVILDFWASWCPNCRRDMPNLNALYEKYADQIEVVAVNLRESGDVASDYINSNGYTFTTLLDPNGAIAQQYDVRYTNYHVLIDKSGQIVNTFAGDIAERHFEQLLQDS